MAIKASATITLSFMVDIKAVYRYYKLQSSTASAPDSPTTDTPTGWSDAEPTYTEGSTNTLYIVDKTVFTNDTYLYSKVSKSTSYEAAKSAYNKAVDANNTANIAKNTADNIQVGGVNILLNTNDLTKWTKESGVSVVKESDGYFKMSYSSSTSTSYYGIYQQVILEANTQYTFSMYVKNRARLYIGIGTSFGNEKLVVSQTSRGVYTFDTGSNTSFRIYLVVKPSVDSNACYFKMPKLEKGNKATEWTPAIQDIDNNISEASKTATNYMKKSSSGLLISENATSTNPGKNVLITNSGVDIRNNSTVLASYTDDKIYLGKNSDKSVIDLCNGTAEIKNINTNTDKEWHRLGISSRDSIELNATGKISMDTLWVSADGTKYADGAFSLYSKDEFGEGIESDSYYHLGISSEDSNTDTFYNSNIYGKEGSLELSTFYNNDQNVSCNNIIKLMSNPIKNSIEITSDSILFEAPDIIKHTHTTSRKTIGFGVGSGGINRGLHDTYKNKWMIYNDENDLYLGPASYSNYRPYYRKGDSITITGMTSGFISGNSKVVHFLVHLGKPVLNSPTVTVTSYSGLMIRQENKYLYGSSSTTWAKPSSYEVFRSNDTINIKATFKNTTNVVYNNDACGVQYSIKITLS